MVLCKICKKKEAVVKINNRWYCKDCFIRIYERKVERLIKRYKLVVKGDKIMVALSGGKDSSALLYFLSKYRNKVDFKLEAMFIDLGISNYSGLASEKVKELTNMLGVKLHIINLKKETGKTLVEIAKDNRRPICSVCGVIKRYYMNKYPREKGFNKVATGHNMDDVIEFFMKNFVNKNFEWSNKLKPVTPSTHKKLITKIRPLYECSNKENYYYAKLNNLPFLEAKCPFSKLSKWKRLLNCFDETVPEYRIQLIKTIEELNFPQNTTEYRECKICGELTTSKNYICSFCRLTRGIV